MTFSDPLKQMIIGVKEHGYGVHLFPCIDTISKGANLTIYVIDKVIELWKERHGGVYPTIIYLQVDGGSENANKYVYIIWFIVLFLIIVSLKIFIY